MYCNKSSEDLTCLAASHLDGKARIAHRSAKYALEQVVELHIEAKREDKALQGEYGREKTPSLRAVRSGRSMKERVK